MVKVKCKYLDCAFLDENYCIASMIEIDSDKGCLTYKPNEEIQSDDIAEDVDTIGEWDDEVEEIENDDEDPWMDDEEDDDEEDDDFN